MDTFFKISSFNEEKECNNIKPFNYNDLTGEINPITKRQMIPEDIQELKNALVRFNKNNGSIIKKCCDPKEMYDIEVNGKKNNNYNGNLFNEIKDTFPKIKFLIDSNKQIKKIQISTDISKLSKNGWELLTPYHVCKLAFKLKMSPSDEYFFWDILVDSYCY